MKTYEYDLTDKEWDKHTGELECLYPDPDVHTEKECANPDYKVWGRMSADTVKFKEVLKDENGEKISKKLLLITAEEYLRCPHDGIQYETEKHDECPMCKKSSRDIIDVNRRFTDELEGYRIELTGEYQKLMREKYDSKRDKLMIKFGIKSIHD